MKKAIFLLITTMLCSCDALNQDPSTAVTTDTAITSLNDLSNAINGAYYIATYGTTLTMGAELSIYADLVGPDSYQPSSSGQNASRIAQFSLTPNDTYNAYYYLYAALANVNKAIERSLELENIDGVAPYLAELYAMRGLFHFHLAVLFAPLPTCGSSNTMGIVLSDKVFGINHIGSRASLDETYSLIVNDLTEAIETGLPRGRTTGHLNHWAALGLRARANLYWGKYSDALDDCIEVIDNSPYSLYTIDEYVKAWSQQGSSEMLMEYLQTDTYNAQRVSPGYYTSPKGYSEYGLKPEFYEWLKADTDDVRGMLAADLTNVPDGESDYHPGFYPLKYPGNAGASVPLYVNNIKVMRLAEIYLIAAESALKTGEDADTFMNALRRNRIRNYADKEGFTIEDIINERRRELYAEGHIAFDLWRNKMSVESNIGPIWPDDYRTILPIPKEEVELANGILAQNPGYGN